MGGSSLSSIGSISDIGSINGFGGLRLGHRNGFGDFLAVFRQADADMIRLRPLDDSRVAPAICLALQLRHGTAPKVPDTALVRGIRRHGPDLLLINHGIPAFPLPDNYAKIK